MQPASHSPSWSCPDRMPPVSVAFTSLQCCRDRVSTSITCDVRLQRGWPQTEVRVKVPGMALPEGAPSAGALLREWRRRRNLSQLELALRSAVSARHLSFIETGRARPSREMVLHLAERLEVPLRDRNRLLLAAGFAPGYGGHSLNQSEMAPIRRGLEHFLAAHEPYPAVVVDRQWNIVASNRGVAYVTRGVAAELLAPPANALRIALHPDGL